MRILFTLLCACLVFLDRAMGWGAEGHKIVGLIAQSFLKDHTNKLISDELGIETLADVGPWADQIRGDPNFRWAQPLHYANVHDHPTQECGYVDERDCPRGNCVVGAISNFTRQLMCTTEISDMEEEEESNWKHRNADMPSVFMSARSMAIRFLNHFMGDLTQPLHVCGRDRGGNSDSVLFGNQHTLNFHQLWDTSFIRKRISEDFNDWKDYGNYLAKQIKSGIFRKKAPLWLSKHSLNETNPITGNLKVIIEWAQDSDALDCSIVWPGFDANPQQDFSLDYYENVISTVDMQLAKAGYRLGHVLNQVFSTC